MVTLKDNLKKLRENVIESETQQFDTDWADGWGRLVAMKSRGHGREGTREVFQFAAPAEPTNPG